MLYINALNIKTIIELKKRKQLKLCRNIQRMADSKLPKQVYSSVPLTVR